MDVFKSVLTNMWFTGANLSLGIALTLFLLIYGFSKEGRDERGRGIIGTASLMGIVLFFILINVMGYFIYFLSVDVSMLMNSLQLLYNAVIVCIDLTIMVLRKNR